MNYIGSKYSLMDFLTETIATVAGTQTNKVFADLFAGTGVVGKTFKEKGYKVISNDIQYYSYVINKHLIENIPPLDIKKLEYINELGETEGFIYKNYAQKPTCVLDCPPFHWFTTPLPFKITLVSVVT